MIGEHIWNELEAAGLSGLPFGLDMATGAVTGDGITPEQRAAVEAVIAAHDPTPRPAPWYERRRLAYQAEVADQKGVEAAEQDATVGLGFVMDAVLQQFAAAAQAGQITLTPEIADCLDRFGRVKDEIPKEPAP